MTRRIGDRADRQHGVISWRQLLEIGLSKSSLGRLVEKGWLRRVHLGVYAVGRAELTPDGRCMAAVLALGDSSFISHRSAAGLWRLVEERPTFVDVTVPRKGVANRDRIVVHRSTNLTGHDTTTRHRIPITRPARTVIDCAENATRRETERLVDAAQRRRLFDLRAYWAAVERHPGRKGAANLAAVLDDHEAGSTFTVNDFEELFIEICDANGIPRPLVNHRLGDKVPDFRWPDEKLIVETDGWETHGTRQAFERDRERDVDLQLQGWKVLHFTWLQLTRRPAWVAAKVKRALNLG